MDHLERLKALRDEARARIEAAKRAIDHSADGRMAASLDELISELEYRAISNLPLYQNVPAAMPESSSASAAMAAELNPIVEDWGASAGWTDEEPLEETQPVLDALGETQTDEEEAAFEENLHREESDLQPTLDEDDTDDTQPLPSDDAPHLAIREESVQIDEESTQPAVNGQSAWAEEELSEPAAVPEVDWKEQPNAEIISLEEPVLVEEYTGFVAHEEVVLEAAEEQVVLEEAVPVDLEVEFPGISAFVDTLPDDDDAPVLSDLQTDASEECEPPMFEPLQWQQDRLASAPLLVGIAALEPEPVHAPVRSPQISLKEVLSSVIDDHRVSLSESPHDA